MNETVMGLTVSEVQAQSPITTTGHLLRRHSEASTNWCRNQCVFVRMCVRVCECASV